MGVVDLGDRWVLMSLQIYGVKYIFRTVLVINNRPGDSPQRTAWAWARTFRTVLSSTICTPGPLWRPLLPS